MSELPAFSAVDVAAHSARDDLWVIIQGKGMFMYESWGASIDLCTVYDVTEYVRDHPGGADVLIDVAGTDATEAYADVGHSEDAGRVSTTNLTMALY